MTNLPIYVPLTFGLSVLLSLYLFVNSLWPALSRRALFGVAGLLAFWLLLQTGLSVTAFYQAQTTPPRLGWLVGPPLLAIIIWLAGGQSRVVRQPLSLERLTWIHLVRIPIELVLLWLFVHRQLPVEMTFEGRNPDILSGLTAPFVAYFGIRQGRLNRWCLLIWNLICLGLLINIVVTALLAASSSFQRFGFDQPNVALGFFPYVLLPGFIVPVVLWSHVTAIGQLIRAPKPAITAR